jgi:hypothetical protein
MVEDGPGTGLAALASSLGAAAPDEVDLTDPDQEAWVREGAEQIEAVAPTAGEVRALEGRLKDDGAPVAVGLAAKLASSRMRVRALPGPLHLSVVLAVYKEHVRILSREDHPHGEDFLRRKLRQLEWLLTGTEHTWDLRVVDDGCPEGSGDRAAAVLAADESGDQARVLHLRHAVEAGLPPVRGLSSVDDSRKGGAIRYGIWDALRTRRPDHVVLYTDADLSSHLGQAGLLLDPLARGVARAAVGSRRHPLSVVVKRGTRDTRGRLFIYLWKRMIPELRSVVDTQCGFKAFAAEAVREWTETALESGFAFDIELLLRVQLKAPGSVVTAPIAWIDSDALSTTADLEPYLDMLKMVVRFYRAYLPSDQSAEGFARLIEALDQEAFDRLVEALPGEIAQGDPMEFGVFSGVSASDLAARAGVVQGRLPGQSGQPPISSR